jgi:hypothetical protein
MMSQQLVRRQLGTSNAPLKQQLVGCWVCADCVLPDSHDGPAVLDLLCCSCCCDYFNLFVPAPWLTKLANAVLTGRLEQRQVELAKDAVDNLERLGPTFIKLGQIMSIRWVLAGEALLTP